MPGRFSCRHCPACTVRVANPASGNSIGRPFPIIRVHTAPVHHEPCVFRHRAARAGGARRGMCRVISRQAGTGGTVSPERVCSMPCQCRLPPYRQGGWCVHLQSGSFCRTLLAVLDLAKGSSLVLRPCGTRECHSASMQDTGPVCRSAHFTTSRGVPSPSLRTVPAPSGTRTAGFHPHHAFSGHAAGMQGVRLTHGGRTRADTSLPGGQTAGEGAVADRLISKFASTDHARCDAARMNPVLPILAFDAVLRAGMTCPASQDCLPRDRYHLVDGGNRMPRYEAPPDTAVSGCTMTDAA